MTADTAKSTDLHTPYWRIDTPKRRRIGLEELFRRLIMASQPVAMVAREAAPRAALVILVAQLVGAATIAGALLITTHVLQTLLNDGPSFDRVLNAAPALMALGGLLLLRIAIDAATSIATAHLAPKVRHKAEETLFQKTLDVDLASFDDPNFYDQLLRARDRGILHIEGAIGALVDSISAIFAVAAALAALFFLHPLLPLLLALAMSPDAWAALRAARVQYAGMSATISLMRRVQMVAELATERRSAPEIRSNQAQNYVLSEYRQSARELQRHLVRIGVDSAKITALGRLLSGVGMVAAFISLGAMIWASWLSLAAAGAAIIAIRTAGASLSRLVLVVNELFEKALYISDYQEFLSQVKDRTRQASNSAPLADPGRIELDDVSFRYPGGASRMALRNVSLAIEPGQTIALVGENGSGKTTLAKLIAGLYKPTSGTVSWNGVDIQTLSADAVADRVAMVLQEPIRWPRSARDNIRIGRIDRADPEAHALKDAAQQSHADEVIDGLAHGWETLLSREFQGGHDLSAGQWQRLAVARGLYRDAPLVIWDEPTAPLDAKAEHAVYESLRRLSKGRTVILITHRLASVRNADRIFYLENGSIAEDGAHRDLLELNGRYAELYRLQAKLHNLEAA